MVEPVIGIVGGSGVYDLPGLTDLREERVASPFGEPSDALRSGRLGGKRVVFLARHGRGHRLAPHEIDYRANVDALKRAGATLLVSVSAVGSYREHLAPGHFVLVDQYVDRTHGRASTFFEGGIVAHASMAHLASDLLLDRLALAADAEGIAHTRGGTLVTMQGPGFSTLAESLTYRDAGHDLIGMTAMPEAKLAREAELPYATVAMVTDFDCWHPGHAAVTVAEVIGVMRGNAARAARLVARFCADFPASQPPCPQGSDRALDHAIVTAPEHRSPAAVARLDAVAGRVLGARA